MLDINKKELSTRKNVILLLCKDLERYSHKNQDVETRMACKQGRGEFKKVEKRKETIKGVKGQSSCLGGKD